MGLGTGGVELGKQFGGGAVAATDWYSRMSAFLFAKAPALTAAIPVKMGISPNSPMSGQWVDAAIEGGAIKSGGAWALASTAVTFLTPKTGPWAVGYRSRMSALGAGHGYLGIVNGAQLNHVTIRTDSTIDATHYNLIIQANAALTTVTSTTLADHLFHDFVLIGDGTKIDAYIDPVALGAAATPFASINNFVNLIDEGMMPGWHFDSGASSTDVTDCMFAYLKP